MKHIMTLTRVQSYRDAAVHLAHVHGAAGGIWTLYTHTHMHIWCSTESFGQSWSSCWSSWSLKAIAIVPQPYLFDTCLYWEPAFRIDVSFFPVLPLTRHYAVPALESKIDSVSHRSWNPFLIAADSPQTALHSRQCLLVVLTLYSSAPLSLVCEVCGPAVCVGGSVMLSAPLSERLSAALRLTHVGPLSETRFTPFEVLTPSSAASPTLLTRRLHDMKSALNSLHFGDFLCFGFLSIWEALFIALDVFWESNVRTSLAWRFRRVQSWALYKT